MARDFGPWTYTDSQDARINDLCVSVVLTIIHTDAGVQIVKASELCLQAAKRIKALGYRPMYHDGKNGSVGLLVAITGGRLLTKTPEELAALVAVRKIAPHAPHSPDPLQTTEDAIGALMLAHANLTALGQ